MLMNYILLCSSYLRLSYKSFDKHPQMIQFNNLKNNVKKKKERPLVFIDGRSI